MDFRDIIKNDLKKGSLILGASKGGEKLVVDISKTPSIIITGETGSGKSILLDQILLELISEYTSLEMQLILVDTSGVELNYYENTNYPIYKAMNDIDKSIVAFSKVLREIEVRKDILKNSGKSTIYEYNETAEEIIPLLVIAIDDDKFLLREEDTEKMLSGIISQLAGLNIMFLLATSDVHNKFFESDKNVFASLLISFDYTNEEESEKNNIEGSNNLEIGSFLAKTKDGVFKYRNFNFEDNIIKEVLHQDEWFIFNWMFFSFAIH